MLNQWRPQKPPKNTLERTIKFTFHQAPRQVWMHWRWSRFRSGKKRWEVGLGWENGGARASSATVAAGRCGADSAAEDLGGLGKVGQLDRQSGFRAAGFGNCEGGGIWEGGPESYYEWVVVAGGGAGTESNGGRNEISMNKVKGNSGLTKRRSFSYFSFLVQWLN